MASSTSTNALRTILVNQFCDLLQVPDATKALFGDQGHTIDGVAKTALPDQTELYNLLEEVDVDSLDITIEDYSVRVVGRLAVGVQNGATISEFALSLNGEFIGVRNSAPKIKDADEEFTTSMLFIF